MLSTIIACALASLVAIAVAVVLNMSVRVALSRQEAMLSERCSQVRDTLTTSYAQLSAKIDVISQRVTSCESGLSQTSGAHLAGELAALHGDVEALAKTVKKNFGRVWQELTQNVARGERVHVVGNGADEDIDDDLAATLRLQSSPPVKPGG